MPGTELGKAYVQIIPSADGISNSIADVLEPEAESAGKSIGGKLGSTIGGAVKFTLGASAVAIGAASAAAADLAKNAVSSYAEYEQLVGGVETLFGSAYETVEDYAEGIGASMDFAAATFEQYQDRQQSVINNANNAYKTAGLSVNEYMDTVNSFAAALNSSLGEYAYQSASYADLAVSDMADNANKMGTSMESIQNAYQGFAKGNFTMLDNLKLGYGGTKSEMERLLAKAEELEGYSEGSLSIDNFADIIEAINIVQTDLGITGTTAKEAMNTIEGSANATKAAWQNVITAIGRGEGLDGAFDGLITAVFGEKEGEGLLNQVVPRIQEALDGIAALVDKVAPLIADKLPALVEAIVPALLQSGISLVEALMEGILSAVPMLLPELIAVGTEIISVFTSSDMLKGLLDAAIQIISGLADGIVQAVPELVPAIAEVITEIATVLTNPDMLLNLLDAALQIILGLVDGILAAIPVLVEALPQIIDNIVTFIVNSIPMIIEAGIQLFTALVGNLPVIISAIVDAIPQIIDSILSNIDTLIPLMIEAGVELFVALVENLPVIIIEIVKAVPKIIASLVEVFGEHGSKMMDAGKELMSGLAQGIINGVANVVKKAKEAAGEILSSIKDFFGIASPSKVFRDQIGEMIPAGIAIGIKNKMDLVEQEITNPMNGIVADAQRTYSADNMLRQIGQANLSSGTTAAQVPYTDLLDKMDRLEAAIEHLAAGVNITLKGDIGELFKLVKRENGIRSKATSYNELAGIKVR